MRVIYASLSALLVVAIVTPAFANGFSFHSVESLEDMRKFVANRFPLGSKRSIVQEVLVDGAGAKEHQHPVLSNVEKYVYDINLCRLYVYRWNISANYDHGGSLKQIFVNGEHVHRGEGADIPDNPEAREGKTSVLKGVRNRPEADLGENKLTFLMAEELENPRHESLRITFGAGPTRADPKNFGMVHAYLVEHWRSIFDDEPAAFVADYQGKC